MIARAALIAAVALLALASQAAATVVYRDAAGRIVVSRNDGSRPRAIAHGSFPVVAPDGHLVVYATHGRGAFNDLWLISSRGGPASFIAHGVVVGDIADVSLVPHWSPNGRYVYFVDGNTGVSYLYDVPRRARLSLTGGGASFAPDSRRVVLESPDLRSTTLFVTSLAGGRRQPLGGGMAPVWGSGGIAYTRSAGLWLKPRVSSRGRLLVPSGDHFLLYPIGWSADGRRLLSAAGQFGPPTWQALLISPRRNTFSTLPPTFSEIDAISGDGKLVLGGVDGTVVAVSSAGQQHVLARGASEASWNR